jgi:hypothetical protein
MNQSIRRFIGFVVLGVFLMGACQSETPSFMPVTGSNNKSALPAQVSLAQEKVLDYVLASQLTGIPAFTDWQLQEIKNENEYHFRSGDWLMVIWAAEAEEHQRVVIVNRVENLSWTGYLASDGRVVDTNFGR